MGALAARSPTMTTASPMASSASERHRAPSRYVANAATSVLTPRSVWAGGTRRPREAGHGEHAGGDNGGVDGGGHRPGQASSANVLDPSACYSPRRLVQSRSWPTPSPIAVASRYGRKARMSMSARLGSLQALRGGVGTAGQVGGRAVSWPLS